MDGFFKLIMFLGSLFFLAILAVIEYISWRLFYIILIIIICAFSMPSLFRYGQQVAKTRCPKCGRLFSNVAIHSTILGIFKKYSASVGGPDADDEDFASGDTTTHLTSSPHVKQKVLYRCKRCSYEWYALMVERL